MLKHKFAVGDNVQALPDANNPNMPPGIYTIVKVLPVAGRGCQYQAKNAADMHGRVLDEALLRPADAWSNG
jgi:hypothetical protein